MSKFELTTYEYFSSRPTFSDTDLAQAMVYDVQGMAKMLVRYLHIVASQEQSTKQGYSVNKITANSNSGTRDPLLFGHVGEQHYISFGNNDGVV